MYLYFVRALIDQVLIEKIWLEGGTIFKNGEKLSETQI